jgi:threonine/homoserine/homoserine lactone efflux protein
MFPPDLLLAYLASVLLVVISPGPDIIFAICRGLGQGWAAAALSSVGAGLGIMLHAMAAAMGLALVLQASTWAFGVVKAAGAAYLLLLGYGAIFAVLTALIFTLLGAFATQLADWLARWPKVVVAANVGTGLVFIGAGLSILALERRQ